VGRFDFDKGFLFDLIGSYNRDFVFFLSKFFNINDRIDVVVFDKIFPTAFLCEILLSVRVVNVRNNNRLKRLILLGFIE